nr:hypothetical protein Iba_chr04fCG11630 [Ipomoea batatas]
MFGIAMAMLVSVTTGSVQQLGGSPDNRLGTRLLSKSTTPAKEKLSLSRKLNRYWSLPPLNQFFSPVGLNCDFFSTDSDPIVLILVTNHTNHEDHSDDHSWEPNTWKLNWMYKLTTTVITNMLKAVRSDHLGVARSAASLVATANNVNQVALRGKKLPEKRTLKLAKELMKVKHEFKNIAKEQAIDAAAT